MNPPIHSVEIRDGSRINRGAINSVCTIEWCVQPFMHKTADRMWLVNVYSDLSIARHIFILLIMYDKPHRVTESVQNTHRNYEY